MRFRTWFFNIAAKPSAIFDISFNPIKTPGLQIILVDAQKKIRVTEIETHAAGIFMAAAYEELTGKRIAVVTQALDRIEERIARLIERWEMEVR